MSVYSGAVVHKMTIERKERWMVAGIAAFFVFAAMLFGAAITLGLWVAILTVGS